jgi:hypothetical protein
MNPVYRNTRSGSALLSMRNSQVSKWAGPGLKYLEERETAMRREWWGRDRERERESDAQGVVREGQRERERQRCVGSEGRGWGHRELQAGLLQGVISSKMRPDNAHWVEALLHRLYRQEHHYKTHNT